MQEVRLQCFGEECCCCNGGVGLRGGEGVAAFAGGEGLSFVSHWTVVEGGEGQTLGCEEEEGEIGRW